MDLTCVKCGGALPPEAAKNPVTCLYCGTTSVPPPEIVVVGRLKPIGTGPSEPETRKPCPRCADYLTESTVHDQLLSACKGCGGVWLDNAVIVRLRQAHDEDVAAAARRIGARGAESFAPPDRSLSIACPVCRQHLRRFALPQTTQPIDVCDAHGAWFDQAEVDELHLFLQAFGARR